MGAIGNAIGSVFKPITDTVKNVFNTVTKPVEDMLKGITGSGFDGIMKGMFSALTNPLSMFGLGNLSSSLLPNIFGGQPPGSIGDIQNMLKDILARLQERQVPGAADGTTVTPPNNLADRFPTDFATLQQMIKDIMDGRSNGSSGSSSSSSAATGSGGSSGSVSNGGYSSVLDDIRSGRQQFPTKPKMPGPDASDQERLEYTQKIADYNAYIAMLSDSIKQEAELKKHLNQNATAVA